MSNNIIYNEWIDSPFVTNEEKEQMRNMTSEQIEIFFSNEPMKFGTAGIRSKMGPGTNQLNKYTYRQLTEGYARFLLSKKKSPKIIVCHDNRRNSDFFSLECAEVLTSFGIETTLVYDNRLLATPIVSYLIRKLQLDGGIIITASHNPKEYNGFKVYNETGCQVSVEESNLIETLFPKNETILTNMYIKDESLIKYLDKAEINNYFIDARQALIKTDFSETKSFPVIFTAHCGTASDDLPNFLNTLGYSRVIKVREQCVPDPEFTNSPCSNPEDKTSFELALKYANDNNASIIIGVDPDADRLAVVVKDKKQEWRYLSGNEMGCIFAYYVLKYKVFLKSKFIVSTFISTSLIDKIAKKFDCEVIKTSTGFKWLASEVEKNSKDKELVVAFEEAIGSLNSTINRDKDSFQAAALALEIYNDCLEKNKNMIDILEEDIYPTFGYWNGITKSYTIDELNWKEKANRIISYFKTYDKEILDGYRFISSGWKEEGQYLNMNFDKNVNIKIRMSGTEPKYKFYFDVYSDSIENSKKLLDNLLQKIDSLVKEIN